MARPIKEVDGVVFSGTVGAGLSADTMAIRVKEGARNLTFVTNTDQASCTVQAFRVDEGGTDRAKMAAARAITQNVEDEEAITDPLPTLYFLRVVNGSGVTANVIVGAYTMGAG